MPERFFVVALMVVVGVIVVVILIINKALALSFLNSIPTTNKYYEMQNVSNPVKSDMPS